MSLDCNAWRRSPWTRMQEAGARVALWLIRAWVVFGILVLIPLAVYLGGG